MIYIYIERERERSLDLSVWFTVFITKVKAHVKSQQKATHIFGKNSHSDVVELAHSILESQISCYKAILLAVRVQSHLDESMLREVNEKKHRKKWLGSQ